MTGASGLIGRRVSALLKERGHGVLPVQRVSMGTASAAAAAWNVQTGELLQSAGARPIDVLLHLAGRSVAQRWSAKVKREVWDSRIPATEKLCAFLATMPPEKRPRTLVTASAIGIYGNRGDELLTEDSALAEKGAGFLGDICLAWEAATRAAEGAGIRVVHVRIGVVLAKDGGALAKLAKPAKLGLGGPVGKGTQFMPWISLTDLSRLLVAVAESPDARGPVNGVGPAPARQHEFMRTLGKVLHRPAFFPLPSFVVKIVFGQMGEEMLLSSLRVIPTKLPTGFAFEHPTLEAALRAELRR